MSENTPGDEIVIYCLSNMYLRHVFAKTSKLFWTTVSHTWNDDETSVQPKCELILLYLGHGRYGEYIAVVTPENDVLTLEDLSTNKLTSQTISPTMTETRANKKKSGISSAMGTDNPCIYRPSNKQPIEHCINNASPPGKRVTRTKCHINYADLNLGIDSNDDSSPPRKHKQSKAVALCEPSQTVIAARNQ